MHGIGVAKSLVVPAAVDAGITSITVPEAALALSYKVIAAAERAVVTV